MKTILNRILSVFSIHVMVLATIVSCTEKDSPENAGNSGAGIPEGNVEIRIMADRETVLFRNPLSGWVIYAPLMDDVDAFWEAYDNFQSSEGSVRVSDYATVLYLRGSWTDFNPEEDVYIWQDGVDTPQARSLRKLEEGAMERDLKLAFTLKTDSRDANANCTPEYVRRKMIEAYGGDGTRGYFSFTLGTNPPRQYWSPYPDDPVFQECYSRFINALADEYDDAEKTMFISGLGMGKWGEYHTCIYSTCANDDPSDDEAPREAVFEWVTDLYAEAFTEVPVFTNYHKLVGCTIGEGSASSQPERCAISERLLAGAIAKGFSMRHDAFGMRAETFGYASWEKDFIADWTYKVPVIGEGGWIVTQGGYNDKGEPTNYLTQYSGPRELRAGEYEDMKSAYVNMMDLRYDASYIKGETWSWFNDAYDLVVKFLKEDCYRVYPDRVTFPAEMKSGKKYTVQHRWLNLGHAYCPTNIRQYEGRFKVAFAVTDAETGKIVGDNIFFDENARPHDWTGGRSSYMLDITPDDIPAGEYCMCVGIVDMALGNPDEGDFRIGIHIAAQGEFTGDGWLRLGKIRISE